MASLSESAPRARRSKNKLAGRFLFFVDALQIAFRPARRAASATGLRLSLRVILIQGNVEGRHQDVQCRDR